MCVVQTWPAGVSEHIMREAIVAVLRENFVAGIFSLRAQVNWNGMLAAGQLLIGPAVPEGFRSACESKPGRGCAWDCYCHFVNAGLSPNPGNG